MCMNGVKLKVLRLRRPTRLQGGEPSWFCHKPRITFTNDDKEMRLSRQGAT
jgi:hypothetical protein